MWKSIAWCRCQLYTETLYMSYTETMYIHCTVYTLCGITDTMYIHCTGYTLYSVTEAMHIHVQKHCIRHWLCRAQDFDGVT